MRDYNPTGVKCPEMLEANKVSTMGHLILQEIWKPGYRRIANESLIQVTVRNERRSWINQK